MTKSMTLAAGLAILSSSAFAQTVLDDSFPVTDLTTIEEMHAVVSADFADPHSAQYKGLTAGAGDDSYVICGWVNSRNSSGGYDQFVPFAYWAGSDTAHVLESDTELGEAFELLTLDLMGCPESAFD